MDELDQVFATLANEPATRRPTIACLYTGRDKPSSCGPMLRSPAPPIGEQLNICFPDSLRSAIALNEAVHDGAVMLGRDLPQLPYQITGWSYRLYPPDASTTAIANRGSAFNSCRAMSQVDRVDRLYLVASNGVFRFERGSVSDVRAAHRTATART